MAQIQTQEKPVTYTLQLLGSDGLTYTADLKVHQDWLLKQLGIEDIVTRLQERIEYLNQRVYGLSILTVVLTDDNKFVSERLGQFILANLPKKKSVKKWEVRKLHPVLDVNTNATYVALKFLVTEGKVTDQHGWVRLVPKKMAKA